MRRVASALTGRVRRIGQAVGRVAGRRLPRVPAIGRAGRTLGDRWMPRFTDYRPLIAAAGLLVAALAGAIVWLAVQAGPTVARLETLAASRSLSASLDLPGADDGETVAAAEPGDADPTVEANLPADGALPTAGGLPGLRQLITAQTDDTPAVPSESLDVPAPEDPGSQDPGTEDPGAEDPGAEDPEPAETDGVSAEPDGRLPDSLVDTPLVAAPVAAITETSPFGRLPKIGPDGEVPWRVYARPFDNRRDRPRVAILVMWLGLDTAATRRAIEALPPAVTLGFMPYPDATAALMAEARADGHETLLMLPMEPTDYPRDDPGPQALLTALSPDMNRQRLEWVMGRAAGYVGLVSLMGGAFVADAGSLTPMLQILARRGLIYVDNHPGASSLATRLASEAGVARAAVDRRIDGVENRDAIDLRLRELEDIARERGAAVGIAHAYPVTLDRLVAWAATLDAKTIDLAPVSALANLQPDS